MVTKSATSTESNAGVSSDTSTGSNVRRWNLSPHSAFQSTTRKNTSDVSAKGAEDTSSTASESLDSQGRPIRIFSSSNKATSITSNGGSNGRQGDSVKPTKQKQKKLGWLAGVFIPCIQNILGVVLFLRLTNITGQAGVVMTTLIILVAVFSTFLTALSLSAIATNGTIQAGGPYYVISRTLGVEIGGALGLLYYFGTTLATSMYVLGAVEALQRTIAWQFDSRWASLILMWCVACVVSVGVKYVNYTSLVFLALVITSIVCMMLGCFLFASGSYIPPIMDPSFSMYMDNIWPNYQPDPVTGITPTFFSLLAIFYPSVTGILSGSSRSAALHNPSESIPKGTLGAIGFTTFIYIAVVWLFGFTIANQVLINDKFVVAAVAWPREEIVAVGVIGSSIGAALQTCASAPRVLAAIAWDDALPLLGIVKPLFPEDEPTRAVWLTWLLASLATLAGNLDHITPLITMFFLLMYAGINLSCFFLGLLKSPGFRPTFRYFHWFQSLVGFVWCLLLVVLVVSPTTVIGVVVLFAFLYLCTKRQKATKNWGDVGNALRYAIATTALRALAGSTTSDFHAKNWRPQVLTVVDSDDCGNPTNLAVLGLASQLKLGSGGIHMVTSILKGKGMDYVATCELCGNSKTLLQQHLEYYGMADCFAQTAATTSNTSEAIWSAVLHSGLGPMSPNTVLLSYPSSRDTISRRLSTHNSVVANTNSRKDDLIQTIKGISNLKKAIILFRGHSSYPALKNEKNHNDSIDVWWVVHDGGLLLLLPYILSKHAVFAKTKLRLFAVTTSITENPDRLREAVIEHLARVRITATVQVVDLSDTTIAEDMREMDVTVPNKRLSSHKGSDVLQDGNTQHLTVGEVFSNEAYEVPYHAVMDDLELGAISSDDEDDWHAISSPLSANKNQLPEKAKPTARRASPASPSAFHAPANKSQQQDNQERLRTAQSFNQALRHYSLGASLVVTNMPLIRPDKPADDFFNYVDTMCELIPNVVLVRGSGVEVITTYV